MKRAQLRHPRDKDGMPMEEGVCWWIGGAAVRRLVQRQAANCQPLELGTTDMCLFSTLSRGRGVEAVAQHSAYDLACSEVA